MRKRMIWIALALLLCACSFGIVRGSGRLATESREVRNFDRVALTGSGEVALTQGDEESLTIEADRNVMQYITSKVENGTLTLGPERGTIVRPTRLKFTLEVKDLEGLTVSGSGDISAERADTDRLEIVVSGSGGVRIYALTAQDVEVHISGSGDVELHGQVTSLDLDISGSGKYHGGDLRSETTSVTISGSGEVTVWATELLDANISGSGSVNYYGDPKTDVSRSGSGKVHDLGDK
jgi:hypothetical protein